MASSTSTEIIQFLSADDTKSLIERNSKTGWPDLQPYQRAFAYEFLIHYNHRQAAEAAGRPANQGLQILRHPLVAAFIEEQQQTQATNSFITKEYITTQYLNMIPLLTGEEDVPKILANGDTIYGREFRPAELRGVLQELSKTVSGFNKDKSDGGSKGGVTVNIDLGALTGASNHVTIDGEIVDGDYEEEA